MSWRKLNPTEKQINKLREWGSKIPKTRGECSDLIGAPKFKCKTCNKIVFGKIKNDLLIIKCCGIEEKYGPKKDWLTTQNNLEPIKVTTLGGGEMISEYGLITYVDDGNGQEWSIEDDWSAENDL